MKKFLLIMFCMVFLISGVSALDFTGLDNYQKFEKGELKYGKVEIWDKGFFLLGEDTKLAESILVLNTDSCLINCEAELSITLFEEGSLIEDIRFLDRQGKEVSISYEANIITKENYQEQVINKTQQICETKTSTNGSYQSCYNEDTYKNVTKQRKIKVPYTVGDVVNSSNYTFNIISKKPLDRDIDWQIKIKGEWITIWAWWNTDWGKKKEIPISENNGTTLVNYTIILNVTHDSDMNNNFSDLRFLNSSENEELGYWIESKVDGSSAIVYVLVPHLTASSNTSIYMYYNNPGVSSTGNVSDAFLWNEEFGGDYDAGDYDVIGTPTISGGIANFNAASESIRWATNLSNPNTDLILTANVRETVVNINYALWGLGGANGIYTTDNGVLSRDYSGSDNQIALFEVDTGAGLWFTVLGAAHSEFKIYEMFIAYNTSLSHNLTNINDSNTVSLTKHVTPLFRPLMGMDSAGGTNFWIDYMRIRKLVIPPPTFSFGAEEDSPRVTTTLISPINNFESSLDEIEFSVNSTPTLVNLTNVTLYIWYNNNTLLLTNFTSLSGNETIITNWSISNIPDGDFIWNALTEGTSSTSDWDTNRTFKIDVNPPIINIIAPNESTLVERVGDNLTLNWTVSDLNLDACWVEYNSTNTTVTCGDNNYSFITTLQTNLTFYANDTLGNLGSNFTSWQLLFEKYNVTFDNQTFEGNQENFTAEIILSGGSTISEAIFYYNNTNYTTNILFSGGEYLVTSSIAVPLVETPTNFSLGFFIVTGGETFNLETFTQEVLLINMSECGPGGNLLLNITLHEEETKTNITGDIEINAQVISQTSLEVIGSIELNLVNISSGALCLSPLSAFEDLFLDVEIKYSSDGFAPELYHIQKADLGTYPQNLSLFDLLLNLSTEFLIKYQDDDLIAVEGAIVQLQRKYISEDIFEIVEAPLTSDIGTAIVHINLNTNKYKATIVKDGVVLDIFDNLVFKCENELSGQCTENLFGRIDPQNDVPLVVLDDFAYSITSFNNTITTLFTIPSGTPSSVNIALIQQDQFGNQSLCNQTIVSSGGSIDCTFEDTIGDSYLDLQISRDGLLKAQESFIIVEDSGLDFLGNNFFLLIIMMLSVVGMAFSSPEWIILNAVIVMFLGGAFWLVNGLDFVMGLGSLIWLLISAGILIYSLSKQEDR